MYVCMYVCTVAMYVVEYFVVVSWWRMRGRGVEDGANSEVSTEDQALSWFYISYPAAIARLYVRNNHE